MRARACMDSMPEPARTSVDNRAPWPPAGTVYPLSAGGVSFRIAMKPRILIVDDDRPVRESLKKVLGDAGYEILCAEDGEQAEAFFSSEAIDLLLLDLDLPKQNGWNVFGTASAINPLLPIIIITGFRDRLDTELTPGVSSVFEKPIEVPILLKVIEGLLAEPAEERLRKVTAHAEQNH